MTSWISGLADPAARAAADADRQQSLKDSAAQMARAKAGCALKLIGGRDVTCGDPAVGECTLCKKPFCEPHASNDLGATFPRLSNLCYECQGRMVTTALGEHSVIDATFKQRNAQREARDRATLKSRKHRSLVTRWNERSQRSGTAFLGLVLIGAGVVSGRQVDHLLVDVSRPIRGIAVTPYAMVSCVALLLGVVALFYHSKTAARAGKLLRILANLTFAYLAATVGALLWRTHGGADFDQVSAAFALGGACLWLVGGHLAHGPAADADAKRTGKARRPHRDFLVALVLVVTIVASAGVAGYELAIRR